MDEKLIKDHSDLLSHLLGHGYKGDTSWSRYCLVIGCQNPSTGHFCFLHWRQLTKKNKKRIGKKRNDVAGAHAARLQAVMKETRFSPVYQLPVMEVADAKIP